LITGLGRWLEPIASPFPPSSLWVRGPRLHDLIRQSGKKWEGIGVTYAPIEKSLAGKNRRPGLILLETQVGILCSGYEIGGRCAKMTTPSVKNSCDK